MPFGYVAQDATGNGGLVVVVDVEVDVLVEVEVEVLVEVEVDVLVDVDVLVVVVEVDVLVEVEVCVVVVVTGYLNADWKELGTNQSAMLLKANKKLPSVMEDEMSAATEVADGWFWSSLPSR